MADDSIGVSANETNRQERKPDWAALGAVLVVDDEPAIAASLEKIFQREGMTVITASNGEAALETLRRHRVAVLLTDLMMPKTDGMDLLRAVKTLTPETEVVLMTAYGTVETAVAAMKDGAYDFVTKPVKRAHVVRIVKNAMEKQSLIVENRQLRAQLEERRQRTIIGTSLAWRRAMDVSMQAAASDATVLLLGESGTGKELLAKAIHENSPRSTGPFVPINCAAIPESILESELFGYEKGAFTGASTTRQGRFETASGGTLFLDEIGDMSPQVQVKLLRVLQEGEIERLGAEGRTRSIDIRLVAATNADLAQAVKENRFREDLYYRLNVVPLHVPPLRDRSDDIPLLAQHFVQIYASKNNKNLSGLSPAAMQSLVNYRFPGNVRELENAIERAVVLSRTSVIEAADLPIEIHHADQNSAQGNALSFKIGTPLDEVEMTMIRETLRQTNGDKRLAAKILGIATRTIYRRLESKMEPKTEDSLEVEPTSSSRLGSNSDGEDSDA